MNGLDKHTENLLSLKELLGLGEGTALSVLRTSVLLTFPDDSSSNTLGRFIESLFSRTVSEVYKNTVSKMPELEIIINEATPLTDAPKLYIQVGKAGIKINSFIEQDYTDNTSTIHPIMLLLASCYAVALGLKKIIPGDFKIPVADNIELKRQDFLREGFVPDKLTNINESYLAGAGAIGNAFLWALSLFPVTGTIHIADPDSVSEGNLNRSVFFTETDLAKNKAVSLQANASKDFSAVKLIAYPLTLQEAIKSSTNEFPIQKLVVAVDSRRVRRNLQLTFPAEVYDASTTGVEEIVVHFNKLGSGLACLSCIYAENEAELAHASHIAEILGVTLSEVNENFISVETAKKINEKYPQCSAAEIQGQAYDSLFKKLCGEGGLLKSEDKQVLAPFAFVSALAGTLLALEFVQRAQLVTPAELFNYWRLSPWHNPVLRLQDRRGKNPACEFCNNATFTKLIMKTHNLN